MKITRQQLKDLIFEEINANPSILLETPSEGPEGDRIRRALFHLSQQTQQLHDMLLDDENVEPWIEEKIIKAADYIEKAFKAIIYEKQHPEGR